MSDKKLIIAVDFDGTCVKHAFPEIGEDIGAVPVLKRLVAEGHKLILYTMRSNCEGNTGASDEFPNVINGEFLNHAIEWFKTNGIELWGHQTNPNQGSWTTSPKCYAHLYIDDAALGAPLRLDKDPDIEFSRPYIDWTAVELILEADDILPVSLPEMACDHKFVDDVCVWCKEPKFGQEYEDKMREADEETIL